MKFRVGDIVRHVNGVKEFVVYTTDRIQCVYGLKEEGSQVVHSYAACHVDRMYKHVSFEEGRPFADESAGVRNCSAPVCPPVGPASDLAVSLRGIPAGYYLKSFRKAEPGDLVLNTSGAVIPAKITQNGKTLYRPIVGKVSSLNASNHPFVEGIPRGWRMVAYRKPVSGEYCIRLGGSEVFQCEEGDWACVQHYVIVKPIQPITPCDGTLPGIPKGYRLVGFGAVNEKQFYIDTVGTLKQGPAKHRLILEPLTDGPVKQPEVVEEYEIDCWGATVWTHVDSYAFPRGSDVRYTGRTRKVVVQ